MADRNDSGALAPAPTVERRLYTYAGTSAAVLRWIITTDKVPMPYLTREEAVAELQRREGDRRAP